MMQREWDLIIAGGGAAGFFCAVNVAAMHPGARILILERGQEVLAKVRVSGGGRCNVTHACFEPRELVKFYPRGARELLGPFHRFGPADTVSWFENKGVPLKTEPDGRMFPVSNRSESIVKCLLNGALDAGVQVLTGCRMSRFYSEDNFWKVETTSGDFVTSHLMLATGSAKAIWDQMAELKIAIVPPVPSLFTFNIKDTRIQDLAGLSVENAEITVPSKKLTAQGPLLVTHWGMSGPAVLRLSAWGARDLAAVDYQFEIKINWCSGQDQHSLRDWIQQMRKDLARKQIAGSNAFGIPMRLWQRLIGAAGIGADRRWADIPKEESLQLALQLTESRWQVSGKSTFKEEFVTAGGVALSEVDFRHFQIKKYPGLYMAGEALDIDAVTGGFNFQAAWTGAYLAAQDIANQIQT